MRAPARDAVDASIAPLRDALLERARADAARTRAEARAGAAARLEHASAESAEKIAAARAEGEGAADEEAARETSAARRRARELVLSAEREALDELRVRVRETILSARGRPEYEPLLERLAAMASSQLGPDAVIERDPPGAGGVRARLDGRRVDNPLVAIADRSLDALGIDVEALWS
ncbi:MAG: V-type ATP synthase subunit E family protein [Actinomycetota bacterium]